MTRGGRDPDPPDPPDPVLGEKGPLGESWGEGEEGETHSEALSRLHTRRPSAKGFMLLLLLLPLLLLLARCGGSVQGSALRETRRGRWETPLRCARLSRSAALLALWGSEDWRLAVVAVAVVVVVVGCCSPSSNTLHIDSGSGSILSATGARQAQGGSVKDTTT